MSFIASFCNLCSRSKQFSLFSSMLLYVHRDHEDYKGQGAQDGHLDFHTAPDLCSLHSLAVQFINVLVGVYLAL